LFAHALVGGGMGRGGGISNSAFVMGYGGGLDWGIRENWSLRLVQFDWLPTRSDGVTETNQVRFGFGIVWKSN
jgi:hypothetical protein